MDIGVFLLVTFILAVGVVLYKGMQPRQPKVKKVCADCGTVGYATTHTKGSFGVELLLWLFFLIPGMIYSVWRLTSRHDVCPACGSANLVPLDTPRGARLAAEFGHVPDAQSAEPTTEEVSRLSPVTSAEHAPSAAASVRSMNTAAARTNLKTEPSNSRSLKILIGVLVLAAIVYAGYYGKSILSAQQLPQDWKEHGSMALAAVKVWRGSLKDPDSAKVRSALLMPSGAWCIDLAAKNGFGAYVRNYMVISPNGAPLIADSLDHSPEFMTSWSAYCHGDGKDYTQMVQVKS